MASTPLQASVENFLEVKEVCFGYVKVTSDYNLSNALTLVAIGHIQASSTFLVQKGISTVEKKRPPLKEINRISIKFTYNLNTV